MDYIHQKGYAHRDIKLENLLLDSEFNLKVADFSFATQKEISSSKKGTLRYMCPEAIAKKPYNCKQADLYSSAIVLFSMVSQCAPFDKAEEGDKFYDLISRREWGAFWKYFAPCELSEDFKDLFTKMVDPDQEQRLTLKQVKAHPFFNGPVIGELKIRKMFTEKKKQLTSEARSEKVTKSSKKRTYYYWVEDGDELLDAVVHFAQKHGIKSKKAKEFYQVKLKIGKFPLVSKIIINVLKAPNGEKRCLEFIRLEDQTGAFETIFDTMKDYLNKRFLIANS